MQTVISEVEMSNGSILQVIKIEENSYHVLVDNIEVQPYHNAEGIIRYLSHILQSSEYSRKI